MAGPTNEPRHQHHERDVDGELRRGDVLTDAHLRQVVDDDLRVVLGNAGERLTDQGEQQDDPEEPAETVLPQRPSSGHRWRNPMVKR